MRYLLLIGTILLSGVGPLWSTETKPNFIVVFCDNLGYGDIEPFGSTLHRTPHLNQMAAEGRKFTHFCVTAGVCTPSRASLLTGCYSQRVGMHNNPRDGLVLRPLSPYGLNPEEVTLAEVLKEQGYATAIVGKWHLGDQPEFLPTRQGFDWFFGIPYSDDMTERVWKQDGSHWPPLPLMENETVIEAPCDRNGLTKRYTEKAIEWIKQHKDERFFLYLPQAMPGSTSTPFSSEAFRGKSKNGPWGDSIEELDWSMGQILEELKRLGLAEKTLVIWTSDNGAPITRDPDDLSRGSNRPLTGRGYTTSEGAFRVPTIAWQPGKIPAGTVCDELATTMDLLPTFAALSGGSSPADRKIDGHNIAPLLFGEPEAKTPYDVFYYYQQEQLQAVRSGPWKLFVPLNQFKSHPHFRPGHSDKPLLFNVVEDIGSQHDVAAEHPDVVARLMVLAEQGRRDLGDEGIKGAGQRAPGQIDPDRVKPQSLPQTSQNALDVIEGVRGGRHWVNAKTDPPKSPEESMKCLQVEPGLEVQLVAAEPLVMDPVAMAFDRDGRMFVAEYSDYPSGPPEGGKPLSRIVYLEDCDGNGTADKRHVFADELNFAHSLMAWNGGLLVGAQTQLLFLKDVDGDHRADIRDVLFDGFQPAHPQMQIGNPRWGLDNWIYCNYAPGSVTSRNNPDTPVAMPRKDMRFHPRTLVFEADSGMGQFGNTIDRWGNRFYATNRNPIMTTLLPPALLTRNPYIYIALSSYDVGPSGGDTQVFPLIEMKSNYLSHAGTHTSACGVTAYNGDWLGPEFAHSVFVCEPIGHLVTRSIVEPDGVRLNARRAREKADFLASTDSWFRPASLATGPDGALYVADMYRLWVEHPKFLPPEIADQLDWRAGDDRGRIYRIVPSGKAAQAHMPQAFVPPRSTADMVALLSDPNGWRQFLGQRLLVEEDRQDSLPALRQLLQESDNPLARLHALWTLDGLQSLEPGDVLRGLSDADWHVRGDAAKLSSRWIENPQILAQLVNLARADEVAAARFQAMLALGNSSHATATDALANLALRDGHDAAVQAGLMTAVTERSAAIIRQLIHDRSFVSSGNVPQIELVKQLASVTGARGELTELARLLELVSAEQPDGKWWRAAIIMGLGQGLPRHQGDLGRVSLASLLAQPPVEVAPSVAAMRGFLDNNQLIAVDPQQATTDRVAAVELLAYQSFDEVAEAFQTLLSTGQPAEVQMAAMEALASNGSLAAAEIVLQRWPELGPSVRGPALDVLLRRTASIKLTLQAMAAGQLRPAALSIDQRVALLKHSDPEVKAMAAKLFGGAVSSNRTAVARQYQPSLELTSSAAVGAQVFKKICAKCHRIDGQGYEVGPDLSDVRNRSKLALLYDILDPNAKVEPRFTAYTVVTVDGKVFSGLIVAETTDAVVLKMAEGKQETISRRDIEQLGASTVSLMPEGVEKEITIEDMANLLEFLKSRLSSQ